MPNFSDWKSDNYNFVGKTFDYNVSQRPSKLMAVVDKVVTNSVDYEVTSTGGYGEVPLYDGRNLNTAKALRGFKAIVTPEEHEMSELIEYKRWKNDMSGECKRVGRNLGRSARATINNDLLRLFSRAFDPNYIGPDGKTWAANDHPNASMSSQGRKYIADPEAGTFSNVIKKALSVGAISEMKAMAQRFTTPAGLPLGGEFNILLVSPEDEETAAKICGPEGKWRPTQNPDDDTNAANPLPDLRYIVAGAGSLGFRKNQWALCDEEMMKDTTKIVFNTEPMIVRGKSESDLIDIYSVYMDYQIGFSDARPIIFSNNA